MIVRLTGGLCNQMFMYAFGRSMSLRRQEPVQFHWMRSTWDYALDKYNVKVDLVEFEYPTYVSKVYTEAGYNFDPRVFEMPSDTYLFGYWQSVKYFKEYQEIIEQDLTLKEPVRPEVEEIAKKLREENSVFVHFRRGDYTNPGTREYHGNLDMAYYRAAHSYVSERTGNPKFYAFSDDPEWVRQNVSHPLIGGLNQHEDLYLMKNCKHGIMANSTFGWWANWFGDYPGRICVAPDRWFAKDIDCKDLIPDRWVKI
jgi:Glycosyl transferase family 11